MIDNHQPFINRAAKFVSKLMLPWGYRLTRSTPYVCRASHYKLPGKLKKNLDQSYLDSVEWQVQVKGFLESTGDEALYKIWEKIPLGHKWRHYFPTYEQTFGHLRNRPIRFLEIGIYKGASLKMWREYFHKDSVIVGIDIEPKCSGFEDRDNNVFCRIGSQSDPDFLKKVVDEFGPFDVILDDGSHMVSHMIKSFNFLFDKGLSDHGIYFAEDTHTNFWQSHRDKSYSFIDFSKDLVEIMHHHYLPNKSEPNFRVHSDERDSAFKVPNITTQIESISFLDSIAIIRKRLKNFAPVSIHQSDS